MRGNGCRNCEHHKIWSSNDYWLPEEHECEIPKYRLNEPDFEISDEELEQVFDRVWTQGEEWWDDQICPYYDPYIEDEYIEFPTWD